MANTKTKRSTEAKCIPIETLTKRLANSFSPINWSAGTTLDVDTAANWLEIYGKDVEALIVAGLLPGIDSGAGGWRVEASALLRFIESNPWWFRVRAEKQLQQLRGEVEAIAHRARFERRTARRAARKATKAVTA